jgi:hypothetical protein
MMAAWFGAWRQNYVFKIYFNLKKKKINILVPKIEDDGQFNSFH